MQNPKTPDPLLSGTRLLVKVLQDLVRTQRFDSYADLVDALKYRCADLRIPYATPTIEQAITQLERGGRWSLVATVPTRSEDHTSDVSEPPAIGREEAAAILRKIRTRLGDGAAPRPMPKAKPVMLATALRAGWQRNRARALAIVLDEIDAASARVAALEEKP